MSVFDEKNHFVFSVVSFQVPSAVLKEEGNAKFLSEKLFLLTELLQII